MVNYPLVSNGTNDELELRASALAPYWARLGGRAATQVPHIWVGDSITEGQNASALGARWADLALAGLRAKYQPAGIAGGFGYYPVFYVVGNLTSAWAVTGTPAATTWGIGNRSYDLNGAGQQLSVTFTGTGCDIHYQKNSAGGNFTVNVDSAGAQTVSANAGSRTESRFQVRGLAAGSHTAVVAWVSGTDTIEGVMVYDGDESAGLTGYEGGHGGWTAGNVAGFPMTGWGQWITLIQPALITIELGPNDIRTGVPAATFQANLQAVISGFSAAVPSAAPCSVIVWDMWNPFSNSLAAWAPYRAAILAAVKAVAVPSYVGVGVVDFLSRFGGNAAADPLKVTSDKTHPNNPGSQYIADALCTFAGS